MHYISTKFGFDSLSCFPFRAQTHSNTHTQLHIQLITLPMARLPLAWIIRHLFHFECIHYIPVFHQIKCEILLRPVNRVWFVKYLVVPAEALFRKNIHTSLLAIFLVNLD